MLAGLRMWDGMAYALFLRKQSMTRHADRKEIRKREGQMWSLGEFNHMVDLRSRDKHSVIVQPSWVFAEREFSQLDEAAILPSLAAPDSDGRSFRAVFETMP